MQRGNLLGWAALLSLLVTTVCVDASWHPRFTLWTNANLKVESTKDALHFSCNGTLTRNVFAYAQLPPQPVRGAAASFFVDLRRLDARRAVSFIIFKDVTLHWTSHGKVATWISHVNGKTNVVGPSKILPGSGKHTVTYTRSAMAFTLFEDGDLVGTTKKPRSKVVPAFVVRALETGSKLDLWVTDIRIHRGLEDEMPWAT